MPGENWDSESLFAALEASEAAASGAVRFELIQGADASIVATMVNYGDLAVMLSVGSEQILAQALLWPVAETRDPAAFNDLALRTHKLMPLSTFGITRNGDGGDYYELFGSLSASSKLENVILELEVLAANAIEAVEAYAANWR